MSKLKYSNNTFFYNDLYCFSNLNLVNNNNIISNIKQLGDDDINLKENKNYIDNNIIKLKENITLNNVFIRNNLNIITNKKLSSSYIYGNNDIISENMNFINNRKKKSYLINNNLNVIDFNISRQLYNIICEKKFIIHNSNKTAFISNNNFIISNHHLSYKDIFIKDRFQTEFLKYKIINIINNLNIEGNLNIYNNLNSNHADIKEDLYVKKDLNVYDSINNNTVCFLPKEYDNIKYSNGSIRYNHKNISFEIYLNNKWISFSKKFNSSYDTGIIYHAFVDYKANNIDIIQNNNVTMTIDNHYDLMNIYKYNVNNNSYLNVYKNIIIGNNINNKYNSNILNTVNVDNNLYIYNNSIFSILSNNNIIPNNNGIIRYNTKYNILETFIDKWKPFQNFGNSINKSKLFLSPLIKDKNYDTIYFNSNNKYLLNLNNSNIKFESNNIIIDYNLNIKNNCINYNISNKFNNSCLNLNLKNFSIIKNGNFLVSKSNLYNNDIICKNNISISEEFYSKSVSYLFYIHSILNIYKICNILNDLFNNNIINNQYLLTNYPINSNFYLDTIIIYFDIYISTTIYIEISDLISVEGNVSNSNYLVINVNRILNKNELYIKIKSTNIYKNNTFKINIKGSYKQYGQLDRNISSIYINELENFDNENRIFYNTVNIENNLNLYNNNFNKLNILVKKNLFIGNNLNKRNKICDISNNFNSIFGYNNNFIFFSNENDKYNNKSLISINSIIDSNSITSGNICIDKNLTNTKNININGNTHILNNLNIKNSLNFSNKNNFNFNININNNIESLFNINTYYNINIKNNIITNNYLTNNIIFRNNKNNKNNIKFNNSKLSIYNNSTNSYLPIIQIPTFNNNNNIYLTDIKDNLNFKYNNNNILCISNNSLALDTNINNNNIISTKNFELSEYSFKINSDKFFVNELDLLKEITNIEKYYYSIYNINISKSPINNKCLIFSYNYPRINYESNLNIYHNNKPKKIEYIAYQFCLGHVFDHNDILWKNNSFILYKPISTINKYNNLIISHNINYPSYNYSNNIELNDFTEKYDFYQNNISYNLNIGYNKTQLLYNNLISLSDSIIKKTYESNYTIRLYPIYNVNDNIYIYYSDLYRI